MSDALKAPVPSLYETDLYAWSQDQSARLRAQATTSLDWEHVAEEIESVGESERSEIESRMAVLLTHLLKWQFQPERRSNSWRGTIHEQRRRINRRIRRSPSLRGHPLEVLDEEYAIARWNAAGETRLSPDTFPADCPFTVSQILDMGYLPGGDQ
ncbi:hypothetical protein Sa4125_38290 [Aureimonas sp. SA4125]|uniref:DUF29 domain-containing protein n=1 Tax=Aureimonas sp. SA4125 TaxID=2826993 RepID=UPI001CC7344E|nr:DUF29 domain-containing protein [Aureimonas sp. SA4125]BDA86287.1 hypothetical protein Sa4125_38290 [Aureimonas sp. SA4125]